MTYIHHGVDLCHSIVISGKLVDLDSVADQLTHDLDFKLVEFTLGNGVGFSNYWNDINLQKRKIIGGREWGFPNRN